MSRCFFCGEAESRRPNVPIKVRGYKDGVRVQKNIRACEYCLSWRNKEDIKDTVGAYEDWD